jgi:hypothetical protein
VRVLFVVDRRAGGEQLGGGLLDLRHCRADHARLRLIVGGTLDHAFQPTRDRQKQRGIVAQMLGASGIQPLEVLNQSTEQRQLFFDRDVFVQHLLEARHQPADGAAGSGFIGVNVGPMVLAQVVQKPSPANSP